MGVGQSASSDLEIILREVDAMLGHEKPSAIGVSFGGPVDYEAGVVRLSHHVPGWEGIQLRRLFEERYGAPAAVDNDANAAALGEFHHGAARATHSALYVTVSTGVGGGWILEGRVWRGANGMAGEIGHTVVEPAGPPCLCGKRGCVERLASGPYMAMDAAELLKMDTSRGSYLRNLPAGMVLDGSIIAEAAARGDDVAAEILQRGARALGIGLGNAANLMNPEVIVLGGGVTKSGPTWWRAVREAARATALPEVELRVVPAVLGDDAPLWGAAAMARALLD
jgi:glucokinase